MTALWCKEGLRDDQTPIHLLQVIDPAPMSCSSIDRITLQDTSESKHVDGARQRFGVQACLGIPDGCTKHSAVPYVTSSVKAGYFGSLRWNQSGNIKRPRGHEGCREKMDICVVARKQEPDSGVILYSSRAGTFLWC